MNQQIDERNYVWFKVGEVGVDSGHIIMGDANYVGHMMEHWQEETMPPTGDYDKFMSSGKCLDATEVYYAMCPGVVCVSGGGDGVYPVYARYIDTPYGSQIAEIKIRFVPFPEETPH